MFRVLLFVCFVAVCNCSNTFADVCPNCGGTGRMISNFRVKDCSACDGDGVVDSGGIPTPNMGKWGYESNKGDKLKEVKEGGWEVMPAQEITETDAINGVVSVGISIYTANPAPFIAWAKALVDRTLATLGAEMKRKAGAHYQEIVDVAVDAINNAIKKQDAFEIAKRLGEIDVKAGAVRYTGENYAGGRVVSRTWGMVPFVAIRLSDGQDSPEPTPGASSPGHDAPETTPFFDDSERTYKVVMVTGTRRGSGTDADVFVSVIGANGSILNVEFDNRGNDRENGDEDVYYFDARNLGELSALHIWHDNSGVGPGWFLEQVRVTDTKDNATWTFDCRRWLARDEDDRKIFRELTVTGVVK